MMDAKKAAELVNMSRPSVAISDYYGRVVGKPGESNGEVSPGFLFESLCDRDFRVYADSIDGQVFHYHDTSGLESEADICLNDGR